MSGAHSHASEESIEPKGPLSRSAKTLLLVLMIPLVTATALGAVLLWPTEPRPDVSSLMGPQAELVKGTVTKTETGPCENDPSSNTCANTSIRLTDSTRIGQIVTLSFPQGPGQPDVGEGDKVILGRSDDVNGEATYYFSDFERRPILAVLAGAFAILVVLVARWRGIGAIAGLLLTWAVLTQFLLPSILEGEDPVLVALVGSSAVVFLALYVAHGFSSSTTTAVLGTLISLGLTGLMAKLAVEATRLTGFSSEETTFVQTYIGGIDIQGLILAGIIIGALGVLNDVTVTQSSAVREIHAAQPHLSRRRLYKGGMRVGRDHIASTVYTLVLAYTGAALPLLILFTVANRGFMDVVGTELVAAEVVRTLVGSLGLILCVPITTGLSAIVEHSRGSGKKSELEANEPAPSPEASTAEEPNKDETSPRIQETEPNDQSSTMSKVEPDEEDLQLEERRFQDLAVPFERRMSRRERKFWEKE